MATQLEIINLALNKIAVAPIKSVDEQSPAAIFMQQSWQHILDSTIASYPWNFAITSRSININTHGFFSLPDDCLITRNCSAKNWQVRSFAINNTFILGIDAPNCREISIEYIRKITNPNDIPPLVLDVFIHALALFGAEKFAPSSSRIQLLEKQKHMAEQRAKQLDAQERCGDSYLSELEKEIFQELL